MNKFRNRFITLLLACALTLQFPFAFADGEDAPGDAAPAAVAVAVESAPAAPSAPAAEAAPVVDAAPADAAVAVEAAPVEDNADVGTGAQEVAEQPEAVELPAPGSLENPEAESIFFPIPKPDLKPDPEPEPQPEPEPEPQPEPEPEIVPDPELTNEELVKYLGESLDYTPENIAKSDEKPFDNPVMNKVYNAQKQLYYELLAGNQSSTVSEVDISGDGYLFTLEQLGLSQSDFPDDQSLVKSPEIQKALTEKLGLDYSGLYSALYCNSPMELVWKRMGYGSGNPVYSLLEDTETGTTYIRADSVIFGLTVAENYRVNQEDFYTVDTKKLVALKESVENALKIVEKHKDETDFGKLLSYCNEIAALSEYNSKAAEEEETVDYRPWTILSIFDNNEETNPVCAGYALAMKFLCDNTVFADKITVSAVTGFMSDIDKPEEKTSDKNAHMWNIVHIDDIGNYLIDITNSDAGDKSNGNYVFKSPSGGNAQDGYYYTPYNVVYTYNKDMFSFHTEEELTLNIWKSGSPIVVPDPIDPPDPVDPVEPEEPDVPDEPVKPAEPAGPSAPFIPIPPYYPNIKEDKEKLDEEEAAAQEPVVLPVAKISGIDEKTVLRPGSAPIKLNITLDGDTQIKEIVWKNSAPDVIDISPDGVITVKKGVKVETKVTITVIVTDEDGNIIEQTIVLTVAPARSPISIESGMNLNGAMMGSVINGKTITLPGDSGQELNFSVKLPQNAGEDDKLVWSVTNPELATVNQSEDGSTVSVKINGKEVSFDVSVYPKGDPENGTTFTVVLESPVI